MSTVDRVKLPEDNIPERMNAPEWVTSLKVGDTLSAWWPPTGEAYTSTITAINMPLFGGEISFEVLYAPMTDEHGNSWPESTEPGVCANRILYAETMRANNRKVVL